jgi:LacI family transcriptional regulator
MSNLFGKRTTLKDVAQKTGYSVNTVSRALRNMPDISPETRLKIQETANSMGYINNTIASSLRLGYTNTIAVIIPDVSNLFFTFMMEDIERTARDHGYSSILLNTFEDEDMELFALQTALNKNVDGILWSPTQGSTENLRFLKESGVPFVLFARNYRDENTDFVVGDDLMGGYMATKHLIDNGHTNIVIITPPVYNPSARDRREGYMKALREAGLPVQEELILEAPVRGDFFRAQLGSILHKRGDVTAVFAFNDMVAWSVFDYLLKRGYRVPEDISIVGYDHIQSRLKIPFQLTSVDNDKSRLSNTAMNILLRKMRGNLSTGQYMHEIVPTWLFEGDTVKNRNT